MKPLHLIGIALSILLAACTKTAPADDPEYKFVEAKVVEMASNSKSGLQPSTGAFFGNDSVRIASDSRLILKVVTDDKKTYILDVSNGAIQTPETLAMALSIGSRIRFPTRWQPRKTNVDNSWADIFSANNIGRITADPITILPEPQ